jgi:hypothetical protein
MAGQYRLLGSVRTADSPMQLGAGQYWLRMVNLVADSGAPATAKIRDESGVAESTSALAEVRAVASTDSSLHFDNSGGGLRLASGCLVTVTGTGAVLYVYGS